MFEVITEEDGVFHADDQRDAELLLEKCALEGVRILSVVEIVNGVRRQYDWEFSVKLCPINHLRIAG